MIGAHEMEACINGLTQWRFQQVAREYSVWVNHFLHSQEPRRVGDSNAPIVSLGGRRYALLQGGILHVLGCHHAVQQPTAGFVFKPWMYAF